MGMTDMANNFLTLTVAAGIALIVLGVGWLIVVSATQPKGRHALESRPMHRGWEGREEELTQFRVSVLVAKHDVPRWPTRDMDTQEIQAIRVGVQ